MPSRLAFFAATALLAAASHAHDYQAGSLHVLHPHATAPAHEGEALAVSLTIENRDRTADRLTAVTSEFAGQAQLHVPAAGRAGMRSAPGLEIAGGSRVDLSPGGAHVMLGRFERPVAAGDRVPVRLVFERAGAVQVDVLVEPATAKPRPSADGHHHHH